MLNLDMRTHREIFDEQLVELERQFKKSVQLVKHVWGKNGFNIYSVDTSTKRGEWSKQFNQGLFQILMYWFTPYEKSQVIPFADLLREELLNLLAHNDEFRETLTGSGTNSPTNVRKKFDMWGATIKGILSYPTSEPRAFSYNRKKSLWDADRTCQLCNQQIATIDDAEVDHIICYWQGGKTIPENGRLTHRYCNRHRGGG
jgi:5-methylcytosine-specific restriction endonuclease McrA